MLPNQASYERLDHGHGIQEIFLKDFRRHSLDAFAADLDTLAIEQRSTPRLEYVIDLTAISAATAYGVCFFLEIIEQKINPAKSRIAVMVQDSPMYELFLRYMRHYRKDSNIHLFKDRGEANLWLRGKIAGKAA